MMSAKVTALLDWCKLHDVDTDPRLHVREDASGVITVYSSGETILPGSTVVRIPRAAVLSGKNCDPTMAQCLTTMHGTYGMDSQLCLALALYYEMLRGPSSLWHGYLQSLPPPKDSDLAVFWPNICVLLSDGTGTNKHCMIHKDAREAYRWARGTELLKYLQGPDGTNIVEILNRFYGGTVVSILRKVDPTTRPSLAGFCHAYSLVSSRAFLVDAYHGLAMVPIADAFNHTQDNHVHLETEYDVCNQCGSLRACVHDREGSDDAPSEDVSDGPVLDDSYEMITNAEILPQEEVFNTYGERLTNAELLAQYGFMLDGNENDAITWSAHELAGDSADHTEKPEGGYAHTRKRRRLSVSEHQDTAGPSPQEGSGLLGRATEVLQQFPIYEGWDSSALVQNIVQENGPHAGQQRSVFLLNADGRISHELWCFIAMSALHRIGATDRGGGSSVETLRRAADLQITLEGEDSMGAQGSTATMAGDEGARQHVVEIARQVIRMCERRRSLMARSSSSEVGELLDHVPEEMKKTRMAMTEAMAELSLLESCESAWKDLLEAH